MVNSSNTLWKVASVNLTLAMGLWGCQGPGPSRSLTVSAAASLQDVLGAIESRFEQRYPQIDLTFNFGASGTLQHQIEQGAPVDVFFPAATQPMDALAHQNMIVPDSRRPIVINQLVLIVPVGSQGSLSSFEELTRTHVRKIMVGEFMSVPVGQYAQEVFSTLQLDQQLQPKLVFAHNVRGVLAAVASGNVDAGIVYATDAQGTNRVQRVATAPAHSHSAIVYPIARVAASSQPETAQAFIDFLSTPEAQKMLTQFGFRPLPGD